MPGRKINLAAMIEGALCIALAIVLSKLNIFALPQGGSVDLELVPLLLFAYRRGPKLGVLAGILTGFVKILIGAHVYHPVQMILDYPLAYAFVGIAAFYPRVLWLILAAFCQIASHVISGVIFFAEYAPQGWNPWLYSIIYNGPLFAAKYAVSSIIAILLWRVLQRTMPITQ